MGLRTFEVRFGTGIVYLLGQTFNLCFERFVFGLLALEESACEGDFFHDALGSQHIDIAIEWWGMKFI